MFFYTSAFSEDNFQPYHLKKKIIVGGDQFYPPYTFLNESGEPDGHDVEMIKKIADLMNWDIEIRLTPWHEALDNLKCGKADLLLTVLYTEERNQIFDFTIPFTIESYSVFTHNRSNIKNMQDLQGKEIIVLQGDAAINRVLKPMGMIDNMVYTSSLPIAIEKVAKGEHDYVLAPLSVVSTSLKVLNKNRKNKLKLVPAGEPIFQSLYRLAVKKGNIEMLSTLNEGIDHLKSNTDLKKLHKKWMPDKYQTWSKQEIIRILVYILVPVVIIMFCILMWSRNLRKQLGKSAIQLQQEKEKADTANQAKTFFLANMSHEIKTSLSTITGFSQILLEETDRVTLPINYKNFLENIKTSAGELLTLINNNLDISKIEAGKLEINNGNVSIKSLIQSVHRINKAYSLKKSIIFQFHYDPAIPENIQSDRIRLNQILTNLINNAIKFTPPGKTIWLTAKKDKNRLILKVRDEGIGIPKSQQKLIFQPYVQVHGSDTKKYGGTGLGLSIVRELVNLLKGSIQLESEENKGTTITISLPLVLAEENLDHGKKLTHLTAL